jgi:hypothetical protein
MVRLMDLMAVTRASIKGVVRSMIEMVHEQHRFLEPVQVEGYFTDAFRDMDMHGLAEEVLDELEAAHEAKARVIELEDEISNIVAEHGRPV